MTQTLTLTGEFNGPQLMDELLAAFPDWVTGVGRLRVETRPGEARLEFPTATDREAVLAVARAHDPAAERPKERLRRQVLALAAAAAGRAFDSLTPAEAQALLAVVLLRHGALGADGRVRPPADWG